MDNKCDINKFSFAQLTSNTDGKTSGSGSMGIYIVFVGGLCFALGAVSAAFITKTPDIMMWSTSVITIGAGLLGWRMNSNNSITKEGIKAGIPLKEAASTDQPPV
jgi:hypothetical protein